MEKETINDVKLEPNSHHLTPSESKMADETQNSFDYNKLYGELQRKLLSTPVADILKSTGTSGHVSPGTSSPLPMMHSPFPLYGNPKQLKSHHNGHAVKPKTLEVGELKGHSFANKLGNGHGIFEAAADFMTKEGISSPTQQPNFILKDIEAMQKIYSGIDQQVGAEQYDNLDIQKLVEEFRVTLEKYGVSQRFAARFIMQDTSQGNLSFLMEKGRNKRWEELSPRGRIPYIKMKEWLRSKDQQLMTLDMLQFSQDNKRKSSRETYSRRERFSMFQLNVLCRLFEENPNPQMNIRNAVADRLNIPLDRVNVWFQNQRARGFPARKILQQSFYNDMPSESQTESVLNAVKEHRFSPETESAQLPSLPMKTSPSSTPPFTPSPKMNHSSTRLSDPLHNISSMVVNSNDIYKPIFSGGDKFGHMLPQGFIPQLPVSNNNSSLLPKQMTDNSDPAMPLDLRASSYSPSSGYSVGVDYSMKSRSNSPEDMTSKQQQSGYPNYVKTETVPINTERRCQSGAAKRKRGIKPQHIIHEKVVPSIHEATENTEHLVKRQKFLSETVHHTNDSIKKAFTEYEYTLQPVLDCTEDKLNSSLRSSTNEIKTEDGHSQQYNAGEDAFNSLSHDKLELFKSVCASLIKGPKLGTVITEPDLD